METERVTGRFSIELTDAGRNKCDTARRIIKKSYLGKTEAQLRDYIKDLERNLAINKGVIINLINANVDDVLLKKTFDDLTSENENLQNRLFIVLRQRDEAQAKLLIAEQVTVDYRKHEQDLHNEFEQIKNNLLDQLSRKEFIIEAMTRKSRMAYEFVEKMARVNQEAANLFEIIKNSTEKYKITDVIDINNNLKTKLEIAEEKIKYLTELLGVAGIHIEPLTSIYKANEFGKETSPIYTESPQPIQHLKWSQHLTNSKLEKQTPLSAEKHEAHSDKNDSKTVAKLRSKAKALYAINLKLSKALEEATKKIKHWVHKKSLSKSEGKNLMQKVKIHRPIKSSYNIHEEQGVMKTETNTMGVNK